ncbi:hypothetical protein L211DRAFT_828534 [Terfezia boudieri ATCC MYA-4762]|uniref:Ribosomal protein L9 domain-containing protein n=1 Tax=Terfezia boudieri ATCC MYA-4762 TaxID=1051890 RepID=A0A3N4LDT5_9PEZI|nr:hypothetical protein L211DRAFT_828534 [Terfezia boudieri ATCC MYA-4762]
MALQPLRTLRLLTFSSCLHWIGATAQQTRGAKKLRRDPYITVQLLQDVPHFGRKGSNLPVARGRMRNRWFPRGMARYLTNHDLKNLKAGDIMAERDITFRPDLEDKRETVDIGVLDPERSHSLLESLLPDTLEFARPTISNTDIALHGSITVADIASTIRAMAAAGEGELSRVVVKPENISFMAAKGKTLDKIQNLGSFPLRITMKEGFVTTRRVVVTRQVSVVDLSSP